MHRDCAKCSCIMTVQSVRTSWMCKVRVHRDCAKCARIVTVQSVCTVNMQSECASWMCKVCVHCDCAKPPGLLLEKTERRAGSVNPSFSSSLMLISEIFIKVMLLALRASSLGFKLKLNTWSTETSTITYQPSMYGGRRELAAIWPTLFPNLPDASSE